MVERRKLSEAEAQTELLKLKGWTIEAGKLHKVFQFQNFVAAFGFMSKVALLAERMNHHPDWQNVYNRVTVALNTHDLGGLSTFDFELAREMDELA